MSREGDSDRKGLAVDLRGETSPWKTLSQYVLGAKTESEIVARLRAALWGLGVTAQVVRRSDDAWESVAGPGALPPELKTEPTAAVVSVAPDRVRVIASLFTSGSLWGVLALEGEPSIADRLRDVQRLATNVSLVLETVRTLESQERRNRELEAVRAVASVRSPDDLDTLCQVMQSIAAHATGSDHAAIHLLDTDRRELVLTRPPHGFQGGLVERFARLPLDQNLLGIAASSLAPAVFSASSLTGETRAAVEREGLSEFAIIPLHANGELSGTLSLVRSSARPYTEDDLQLAVTLGVQVSIQIERARLSLQERERVRQLSLLLHLSQEGLNLTEPVSLARAAAAALRSMVEIEEIQVHVLGSSGLVMAHRESAGATNSRLDDLVRRTANERRAVASASDGPTASATPALAVPMLGQKGLVGVLGVGRRGEKAFGAADVGLLQAAAAILAAAFERYDLLENERRRAADLARVNDRLEKAQAELVRKERLAGVGELAAVIAHEVRNPLGAIFNALSQLRRSARFESSDAAFLLDVLHQEGERLNRIVGDLLDFARPSSPRMVPASVDKVLRSAIELTSRSLSTEKVRWVVDVQADLPPVAMDEHLMLQALVNVLTNAVEAEGGTGVIEVHVRDLHDGTLRLSVEDEGSGVSAENMPRVFEPFFSTKANGTGLGLAIVKRTVESHGGEVRIASRPGRGTIVTLNIPFSSPDPKEGNSIKGSNGEST